MRIRTIAAALVVAAPLLALGSPQATACWETGYRSAYTIGRRTGRTSSLRLYELRLLFARLLWWLLRWRRHPPGWLPGCGFAP